MISSGVHVAALGFADELFLFDSTVLEPDGDLALREVGGGRNASPLVFGDELACGVFLFQLLQLDLGVRDTFFASSAVAADLRLQGHDVCEEKSRGIISKAPLHKYDYITIKLSKQWLQMKNQIFFFFFYVCIYTFGAFTVSYAWGLNV